MKTKKKLTMAMGPGTGVEQESIPTRRGGWLAGHEAAREARLAACAGELSAFAASRQAEREAAKAIRACNGTPEAVARRSSRVARLAPLSGAACRYFVEAAPVYRLGAAVACNGSVSPPAESGKGMPLLDLCALQAAADRAELRARKWTRGTHSSSKGAQSAAEVGAAASADDLADYYVRLEGEAVSIFRWAALGHVQRVLCRAGRLGVRLNWSDIPRLAGSVRAARAARKAAEAWEYAAIKLRDGREVGGDYAMQGGIHGVRDFWLRPAPADTGAGLEADDYGAAEWSAALDGAAARLGIELGEATAAIPDLSAEMAAAIAEAADVRGLGSLSCTPAAGSGSGSGRRPSVMSSLLAMADNVREAVAERVRQAASNQAAIQARIAGDKQVDIVASLRDYVAEGAPLPPELVAEFWPAGDTSLPLSATARSKIKRIRDRSGLTLF